MSEDISKKRIGLLKDPAKLQGHIQKVLCENAATGLFVPDEGAEGVAASSVLFLLGLQPGLNGAERQVCIILNKRSRHVKQSGDLCCPGGSVEPWLDPALAGFLRLPGFQLSRWPCWPRLKHTQRKVSRKLSLFWATGLREAWEEMRLNPFKVRFLGPLPTERLILFDRVIVPLVGWVAGQECFTPNWEVEKVLAIPIQSLFQADRYARYRLFVADELRPKVDRGTQDFLCFLHQNGPHVDILWGATFRIVLLFLKQVFGFVPPDESELPIVPGLLDKAYMNGRL